LKDRFKKNNVNHIHIPQFVITTFPGDQKKTGKLILNINLIRKKPV